jgi:starch synthase (maltosyl-transferring)
LNKADFALKELPQRSRRAGRSNAPRVMSECWKDVVAAPTDIFAGAQNLGFSGILIKDFPRQLSADLLDHVRRIADAAERYELEFLADIAMDRLPLDHPLAMEVPSSFGIKRGRSTTPIDPRAAISRHGDARLRELSPMVQAWWTEFMSTLESCGINGFHFAATSDVTAALSAALSTTTSKTRIVQTWSLSDRQIHALLPGAFDFTTSSLPWWTGTESWLLAEHSRLSAIAPVLAPVAHAPGALPSLALRRLRLAASVVIGEGLLMPSGFAEGLEQEVKWVNGQFSRRGIEHADIRRLGGGSVQSLRRRHRGATKKAKSLILVMNRGTANIAVRDLDQLGQCSDETPFNPPDGLLAPGGFSVCQAIDPPLIQRTATEDVSGRFAPADPAKRTIISTITPALEAGMAVKRIVGDTLTVQADIFTEGHGTIAAHLLFRANDADEWHRVPMRHIENDRWAGSAGLWRIGGYVFVVEAWRDEWASLLHDIEKKRTAGILNSSDLHEGKGLVLAAAKAARGASRTALRKMADMLDNAPDEALLATLTSPELSAAITNSRYRPFLARSVEQPVHVDREAARFSSWYELFPRSTASQPNSHGTLADVVQQLPAIRAMGFDTLYFPPIHPIGQKNRKGANNSLRAKPDEPGSPYAIGASTGGHDALHPDLGSFDDFRHLVDAARDHGIEIALDFAIQCSPDHPWLTQHPAWFVWRKDGTIKYAENPPKRYEDIVNVDFYQEAAVPELWHALRDIVRFWIAQGIRCFRVDNPHTKPFPFWQWLIGSIQAERPDVIFLSEAFTRPKVMYHLAKIGFTQSYTYFTWRNAKAELTDYFTELATTEVKEYFRPHLFVNTPDINPFFLQKSGRAGFLIRACLGATLSGLFGVYSGFELCEADPLPGKEEYLNSEKYEIKHRDLNRPGNIIPEITALNQLRRIEPALQTHLNTVFYNAFNTQILYYGKHLADRSEIILVAVNLDPHHVQEADHEIPLWEFGLSDDGAVSVENLLTGQRLIRQGKLQHMRLEPSSPYSIWRIRPLERS